MKHVISIFLFFLILAQIGCSDSIEVTVEIDNPKHRQVYLEHLISSGLEYTINPDRSFKIKVESHEKLKEKMKGFDGFVSNEIKENNRRLNSNIQ